MIMIVEWNKVILSRSRKQNRKKIPKSGNPKIPGKSENMQYYIYFEKIESKSRTWPHVMTSVARKYFLYRETRLPTVGTKTPPLSTL
jgi:hypothetical protein